MHDVFISYARADAETVDHIAAALEKLQVRIWLDRRDIPVSIPWFEEVRAAVEAADLMAICASPNWEASKACQLERRAAEEGHKRIHPVDIRGCDPQAAALEIARAYQGTPPAVWDHTEITVRAARWGIHGRRRDELISGGLLRRAKLLLSHQDPPLTPLSREFVFSSARRQRRRRWTASLGTAIALVAVVAIAFAASVRSVHQNVVESAAANLGRFVQGEDLAADAPYEELMEAREAAQDLNEGHLARARLTAALSAALPDLSYTVGHDRLVGFAAPPTRARVAVMDARGRVYTGRGRSAATPGGRRGRPQAAARSDGNRVARAAGTAVMGTSYGTITARVGGVAPKVVWRRPADGAVTAIAVAPDGRHVAAGFARSGTVRILSVPGFDQERALVVSGGGPSTISFSPNGRFVAVGRGEEASIFDRGTGMRLAELRGSLGAIRRLAWSAQNDRVWAIAGRNRVSSWQWRLGDVLIDDPTRWFVSVVGPTHDGRLAAVDRRGTVSIVDPKRRSVSATVRTSASAVLSAAITRAGTKVALGNDGSVHIRDLNNSRERVIRTRCTVVGLAFNDAGDRLYTTCLESGIHLYDPRSSRRIASARIPGRQALPVTVNARGEVFVGDNLGELHRFDAGLRQQQRLVDGVCGMPARSIAVSSDGHAVIFTGDGAIHATCIYEAHRRTRGWERIFTPPAPGPGEQGRAVALTPDGDIAAVGFSDGTVRFWRPHSLDPGGSYRDFGGEVRGLAFTADNEQLVVATRDGIVELVPACPLCGSMAELAAQASDILDRARRMQLTKL